MNNRHQITVLKDVDAPYMSAMHTEIGKLVRIKLLPVGFGNRSLHRIDLDAIAFRRVTSPLTGFVVTVAASSRFIPIPIMDRSEICITKEAIKKFNSPAMVVDALAHYCMTGRQVMSSKGLPEAQKQFDASCEIYSTFDEIGAHMIGLPCIGEDDQFVRRIILSTKKLSVIEMINMLGD